MNEWEWQLLEDKTPVDCGIREGDHVKLHPRAGGDVMDLALADKIAVVDSIEQDYEGSVHISVVLEDDPGSDIGTLRQPGHRFFFRLDEVELVGHGEAAPSHRILLAGIGNIFFGDDGFGVELAARLKDRKFPKGTRAIDFGIRSYDLAYALTNGQYDTALLIDAVSRGGAPGTIYVLEPELEEATDPAPANAHMMTPDSVLKLARALGPLPAQILIVGCEPETLGGEEGRLGLSETIAAAVDHGIGVIESLVARIARGEKINQEATEWK